MKLILRRNQSEKRGLIRSKGMEFTLYAKVDLSPEEESLVSTYTVEDYIVGNYEAGKKREFNFTVDVKSLMNGYTTVEVDDVYVLTEFERQIKESCGRMKTLLGVLESFGGEEIVEY
jgi:hypothetical protein